MCLRLPSVNRSILVRLEEADIASTIKKILTCWMETDPSKDPLMDNLVRLACMACIVWVDYHAVVHAIERFA